MSLADELKRAAEAARQLYEQKQWDAIPEVLSEIKQECKREAERGGTRFNFRVRGDNVSSPVDVEQLPTLKELLEQNGFQVSMIKSRDWGECGLSIQW